MAKSAVNSEYSVEVKKYLEEVLNETKETRFEALDQLRDWAALNSNLHVRTEDAFLVPFLRNCKYNVERTKEKLTNFYKMRRDVPEWFSNRDTNLPVIQDLVKMGAFTVMKKTYQNMLVLVARPTIPDPGIYDLDTIIKVGTMVIDVCNMENELAQIYGVYAIIDLKNSNLRHVRYYTPSRVKNIVNSWQSYHCRPKKIFIINAPVFVHVVLNIFKSFMPKKLRERMHVSYEDHTALINAIDVSILPKEYGGEETIEELGQSWMEKFDSYHDWFLEDEKYKAE